MSTVQYEGATYSYGPDIFPPLSPVMAAGFAVADETIGFGHIRSFATCRYVPSTSGGGGLSLPLSHITMLGWLRNRYIWSRSDAFAMSKSSGAHFDQCSQ